MTHRDDEAEIRLRAADPAGPSRSVPPARSPRTELLEAIMSTTTTTEAPARPPRSTRPRWILAGAAVAAAAIATTVVALNVGDDPAPHASTVARLSLPAGPAVGQTCIRFTVGILADKPVAFDGTATEVTDRDVLLDVNHWYRGGTADQVRLTSSVELRLALEGTVDFTVGDRYLVTATDGVVNYCGYTVPWSPALARDFQDAFGG